MSSLKLFIYKLQQLCHKNFTSKYYNQNNYAYSNNNYKCNNNSTILWRSNHFSLNKP